MKFSEFDSKKTNNFIDSDIQSKNIITMYNYSRCKKYLI